MSDYYVDECIDSDMMPAWAVKDGITGEAVSIHEQKEDAESACNLWNDASDYAKAGLLVNVE